MADAQECRRQAAECTRLSRTRVAIRSQTIMRSMARSWVALAVQMDRLDEHDPANAATWRCHDRTRSCACQPKSAERTQKLVSEWPRLSAQTTSSSAIRCARSQLNGGGLPTTQKLAAKTRGLWFKSILP